MRTTGLGWLDRAWRSAPVATTAATGLGWPEPRRRGRSAETPPAADVSRETPAPPGTVWEARVRPANELRQPDVSRETDRRRFT